MDKRYDEINYYIYDKIEKYNSKFAEFQKTLDNQDLEVKKKCSRSVRKNIQSDPKKHIKKLVDLTKKNDDLTEDIEGMESEHKKMLGGGENDYDDSVKITEIITEEAPEIIDNSYETIAIALFITFILYVISFVVLINIDKEFYDMLIFKPITLFTDILIDVKKNVKDTTNTNTNFNINIKQPDNTNV